MISIGSKIYQYTVVAFCTAIICILAQLTIPLPLIPITGQTLAICLIATILPVRLSVSATSLYLLMGAIGLPVFQNATAGFGILSGPTGGYLFSFIVSAFIISFIIEKLKPTFIHIFVANITGTLLNLICGSLWIMVYLKIDIKSAFLTGFLPFLIVGIIKAVIATMAGMKIRTRLRKTKLFQLS